jgi:hypothetical protein
MKNGQLSDYVDASRSAPVKPSDLLDWSSQERVLWSLEKQSAVAAVKRTIEDKQAELRRAERVLRECEARLIQQKGTIIYVAKVVVQTEDTHPHFNPRFDTPFESMESVCYDGVVMGPDMLGRKVLKRVERPTWREELSALQDMIATTETRVEESKIAVEKAENDLAHAKLELDAVARGRL